MDEDELITGLEIHGCLGTSNDDWITFNVGKQNSLNCNL